MKTRKIAIIAAAALLCLGAAFAATGCQNNGAAGKQAAIDAYKEASANSVAKQDYSAESTYEVDVAIMGESVTVDGDCNFAYKLPSGKNASLLDAELAADLSMNMKMPEAAAGAGDQNMDMGVYLTDKTLYLDMNVPGTDPTKIGMKLSDADVKMLEEGLSQLEGLDLSQFNALEMFPIDDYVRSGSFGDGVLNLDIDIIGYVKFIMNEASKLSGGSMDESLKQIEALEGSIKNSNCQLMADISDDMKFKDMKLVWNMTIDAASLSGTSSSNVSMDMDIDLVFDVSDIKIDTGGAIKMPSFKGFDVQTVKLEDLASSLLPAA